MAQQTVKTPVGDAPVVPLFLLGTGMYLAWFLGVHYWRSDVKYPTDPIKGVLTGKGLPGATRTPTAEQQAVLAAEGQGITTSTAEGQAVPGLSQGIPAGVAAPRGASHNQQVGALLAAGYGWGPQQDPAQWDALVKLWDRESGWSNTADTRVTHAGGDNADSTVFAYGIPQARPYDKMPQPGWPPDKGGQADPHAQIAWGLAYIRGRYGSPSGAWATEQAQGSY